MFGVCAALPASAKCGGVDYSWGADALALMHDYVVTMMLYVLYLLYGIYQELILGSVEIVNDIRQVCLSDTKMTEKQRIELVFGIRPKLKAMNRKLRHLTLAVKYTSLADVWATIDEGARPQKADKAEIARAAMRRWRRNGDL